MNFGFPTGPYLDDSDDECSFPTQWVQQEPLCHKDKKVSDYLDLKSTQIALFGQPRNYMITRETTMNDESTASVFSDSIHHAFQDLQHAPQDAILVP